MATESRIGETVDRPDAVYTTGTSTGVTPSCTAQRLISAPIR